ncbi:unnamed protein product [Closterium sp. NIES-54]
MYTTVFPLAKKSEVTSTLIRWLLAIEGTRGSCVRCLHSDRGSEFCSGVLTGFCGEQGIRGSWTLPESPEQNGVAERCIGLVMDITLTSMNRARVPQFLWPYVLRYTAHQLNLRRVSRGLRFHRPVFGQGPLVLGAATGGTRSGGAHSRGAGVRGAGAGGTSSGDAEAGGSSTRGASFGGTGAGGAGTGGASSGGAGAGGTGSGGASSGVARAGGAGTEETGARGSPTASPTAHPHCHNTRFQSIRRLEREEQERVEQERQELQQLDQRQQ